MWYVPRRMEIQENVAIAILLFEHSLVLIQKPGGKSLMRLDSACPARIPVPLIKSHISFAMHSAVKPKLHHQTDRRAQDNPPKHLRKYIRSHR